MEEPPFGPLLHQLQGREGNMYYAVNASRDNTDHTCAYSLVTVGEKAEFHFHVFDHIPVASKITENSQMLHQHLHTSNIVATYLIHKCCALL